MTEHQRAYSFLEIKEMDDETGVITGIASTITTDRGGDVVMPEGAEYKLPIPFLWQHDSRNPIGQVTDAKVTKKGIEIVAKIAIGVSDEIDRSWKLIRAGLVRGLSIGFRGIDMEQIPNSWGVIFEKWEWLELSAVTIPMNAEATITTIKHYDVSSSLMEGADTKNSADDTPAAPGKKSRVVKLNQPARVRAPFKLLHVKTRE